MKCWATSGGHILTQRPTDIFFFSLMQQRPPSDPRAEDDRDSVIPNTWQGKPRFIRLKPEEIGRAVLVVYSLTIEKRWTHRIKIQRPCSRPQVLPLGKSKDIKFSARGGISSCWRPLWPLPRMMLSQTIDLYWDVVVDPFWDQQLWEDKRATVISDGDRAWALVEKSERCRDGG